MFDEQAIDFLKMPNVTEKNIIPFLSFLFCGYDIRYGAKLVGIFGYQNISYLIPLLIFSP